jgi:hypothetical protein
MKWGRLKMPPLSKSQACSPSRSRHTIPARTPSSTAILQSSTLCADFSIDTKRRNPLCSSHQKATCNHLTKELPLPLSGLSQHLWKAAARYSAQGGSISNMVHWVEHITGTEIGLDPAQ